MPSTHIYFGCCRCVLWHLTLLLGEDACTKKCAHVLHCLIQIVVFNPFTAMTSLENEQYKYKI